MDSSLAPTPPATQVPVAPDDALLNAARSGAMRLPELLERANAL